MPSATPTASSPRHAPSPPRRHRTFAEALIHQDGGAGGPKRDYVEQQHARVVAGRLAAYAQGDMASGRVVGATAFWDPRCREDRRL